jgi:lipopolysaccharide biosynthesis regulator YciM
MVQRLEVRELERDYIEFWPAGTRAKGEYHCSDCGYGVVVTTVLPLCPMCSCESWEQAAWSPFRRTAAGIF